MKVTLDLPLIIPVSTSILRPSHLHVWYTRQGDKLASPSRVRSGSGNSRFQCRHTFLVEHFDIPLRIYSKGKAATNSYAIYCSSLQSLKSRGYVKEQFAWRTYYWYLTNEGIQYLRDYLHLPAEIVPSTLKRQARAEPRPR